MRYTAINKDGITEEGDFVCSNLSVFYNKDDSSYDLHIVDNRTYVNKEFIFNHDLIFKGNVAVIKNYLMSNHGYSIKRLKNEMPFYKDKRSDGDEVTIFEIEGLDDYFVILVSTLDDFKRVLDNIIECVKYDFKIKFFKEQFYKEPYTPCFGDPPVGTWFGKAYHTDTRTFEEMDESIYYSFGGVSQMLEITKDETYEIVEGFYDKYKRTPMVKLFTDNPDPIWRKSEEEINKMKKSAEWQSVKNEFMNYRRTCFKHHGKQCLVCEEDEVIDVHHIDGDRKNNKPENLVPLCPLHHRYLKSKKKNALVEGIIAEYISEFNY